MRTTLVPSTLGGLDPEARQLLGAEALHDVTDRKSWKRSSGRPIFAIRRRKPPAAASRRFLGSQGMDGNEIRNGKIVSQAFTYS